MIKIRASSLGKIMTDAKSIDEALVTEEIAAIQKKKVRTDEENALLQALKDQCLSAGAKTFLEDMAKEYIYCYHKAVTGKEMEKGILVESDSIELYNTVFFTNYTKNTERKHNEWITGECDIFTGRKIVDIKSSWSIPTFPATIAAGLDSGYEWQLRAYMMLWNVDHSEIAYCLVNTPDELIGYEDPEVHYVDHINPALRVTVVPYDRDDVLENKIKKKVEAANKYLDKLVLIINEEHNI